MKPQHMPRVDARYWTAITLASLFGTNLGDLYAHDSGLGLLGGLPVLGALLAGVFLIEGRDDGGRELYYWLAILLFRTGATNIADYAKKHLPWLMLGLVLAIVFALLALWSVRGRRRTDGARAGDALPRTGAAYWSAMLAAGVFGTFFGDMVAKLAGKGGASLALGALLIVALLAWRRWGDGRPLLYWIAIAVARTAGTAMGDWLAESDRIAIGLPWSTAITGSAFLLALVAWPGRRVAMAAALAQSIPHGDR